jgi:spore coat protein U-like protein
MTFRRCAAGLLAGLALAAPARAATCTVNNPTLAFGSYSVLNVLPLDSTGTMTVTCTSVLSLFVSFTVQLAPGNSGNQLSRYMSAGSAHLSYNAYTDATRTTVWGNGSGGTGTFSGGFLAVLLGAFQTFVIYGRIPAQQAAPVGTYTDTLVITVTY